MRYFLLIALLGWFTAMSPAKAQNAGDMPANDESAYVLSNPSPNPFKETTNIAFALKKAGLVNIKIYNLLGNEVALVLAEQKATGSYSVPFDGKNLRSGIYFLRFSFNGHTTTRKLILTD